ncbi:ATP-binding protein [Methylobacterium iners]|uniref:histidine kinase n=1 Tax=Methylobacterium iners TaxID=418707 RepID=A0ABQ4S0Q1_9HYPH|nr:ATP-binding protein [Methylobacterium iners]GJD96436.1 Cell-division control histidine kinase PdhS [Methylobacterium iners]
MSESGAENGFVGGEATLDAVCRRLDGDARFGPILRGPAPVVLVLDAEARRVLGGSGAARDLLRIVAGPDGRLQPALRLEAQLGRSGGTDAPSTLVRLQFDPRRLGPPTTCLLARTRLEDGSVAIVLALTGAAPRLRRLPPLAEPAAVEAPPAREEAVEAPELPAGPVPRFVWRTDGDGRLDQVSGPAGPAMQAILAGQSWAALSAGGTLIDAGGLLAALAERRTFRAIPLTLRRPGNAGFFDLELSGAPLSRAERDFTGYGGFGLVRPSTFAEESVLPAVAPRDERADPVEAEAIPPEGEDPASPGDGERDAVPVVAEAAEDVPDEGESSADRPSQDAPRADFMPEDAPERAPAAMGPPEETRLSGNEHAAFREIARALGVRFAGDEVPEERATREPQAGAVMPFPAATRPVDAAADPDAALAATLDRLPTGLLIYRDGTALFANRSLLDLARFADLPALEDAGGLARLFNGLVPHERPSDDALAVMTTREGASLNVDLQCAGLDWQGAPARLLLVREATWTEPAEQLAAARVAQEFADRRAADALAVLDALDEGIVTLDGNGRILGVNRSAASTFGLDPREVVGGSVMDLFAPESAVAVLAILHAVPGAAPSDPVIGRGRNGPVALRLQVSPLRDGDPTLLARLTPAESPERAGEEVAEARRAAMTASARKSEFLAWVSHEVRTPVSSILGFADVMLMGQFGELGNERYRSYLRDIRSSGEHVLNLVNDLLDLARIEAGHLDLARTEISLNEIVSRCVALMQPQAARQRILIRTSFSNDVGHFVADERSVHQAVLNVIANALRLTEPGGQVIVATTLADRGEIALRVRDTGAGMTPEEVETALEPFRRIDAQVSSPESGTGLGLPLTKALVEANQGRFRISSRKAEGTLVEMLFPAPQALRA